MADNLRIRKLRVDLAKVLNECLLPIEVKRMIVNDLNNELAQLAETEIQKEIEAEKQKEEAKQAESEE